MEVDEAIIVLSEAFVVSIAAMLAAGLTSQSAVHYYPPPARNVLEEGEYALYVNGSCLNVTRINVTKINCGDLVHAQRP